MTKGDRIRSLRLEKGITQEEMARLLNTTKQTISKYEKSIVTNIPSNRIEAMAKLLDTTPEYILGWEKVQKNNNAITDIVVRIKNDEEFFCLVEMLNSLDKEKIAGVQQMISAFLK